MKTSSIEGGVARLPLKLRVFGLFVCFYAQADAATVSWVGGTGDWNTPTNWSANALPGPDDAVVIDVPGNVTITYSSGTHSIKTLQSQEAFVLSGGSLSISNSAQFGATVILSGGTLSGSGDVTISGTLNWTGTTMSGSGKTVISAGTGVLNMSSATTRTLNRVLQNDGATLWTGGNLQMGGGTFNNNGSFIASSGGPMQCQGSGVGGSNAFNNIGTFSKQGTGITTFCINGSSVPFNNSGQVDVQAGTLGLNAGGANSNSMSMGAAGTLSFAASYTHAVGSSLSGSGTLTITSGTHIFPTGTFTPAGAVNLAGGNTTINNPFTPSVMGAISSGTVTLNAGQGFSSLTLSGGTLGGTGDVTVAGVLNWSGGTMTGSGRTLVPSSGTLNLNASTHNLNRVLQNDGAAIWTAGALLMVGGTFNNHGSFTANSAATLECYGNGGTNAFNNLGTVVKQGAGLTRFGVNLAAVPFNNSGTVDVQAGTLGLNSGGMNSNAVAVGSAGTVSFAASYTHAVGSSLNGSGTLTITSGTHIFPAGTFTPTGAVNLSGSTTTVNNSFVPSSFGVINSGTLTLNANQSLVDVTMNGGTLGGTGDVKITGALTWSAGAMRGPGKLLIAVGATGTLSSGNAKNLTRIFENAGTVNYLGTALQIADQPVNTTLNNLPGGVFNVTGDGDFPQFNPGVHAFNNAGTFNKSGIGTTTTFTGVSFNNSGVVNLNGGTLELNSGGNSNGSINVEVGTTLNLNGTATYQEGSTVSGAGTINFNGGAQTFAGLFLPTGTVSFNGGTTTIANPITPAVIGPIISGATVNFNVPQQFQSLTMFGGTLGGSGDVTIAGTLDWTGGTMLGTGKTIVAGGATATFGFGGNLARTIENAGTFNQTNGFLRFGQLPVDTTFNNLPGGVFNMTGQGGFSQNNPGNHAFNNAGRFNKSGAGTITSVTNITFNNTGNFTVSSGSLEISGDMVFPETSTLQIASGATLRLFNSSLTGAATNSSQWKANGRVLFEGRGVHQMEVMGRDMGSIPAGQSNNFAYATIELGSATNLTLVDIADNTPGSEALYVDNLIIPFGATLNLGGFHLYYRAAQTNGVAIVGGTIIPVAVPAPDNAGPIAYDSPTSGAIAVGGEVDEWSFFGRAGSRITVAVETGGANVAPPRLGNAEVRLFDPSSALLTRSGNAATGQPVLLSDLALPVDGTYRVQIRAHANQPLLTGNYRVSVWGTTVKLASLVLNQTMNGRIETPYSVDRWTFSAVAGQQLQFDLLSASASGVAFTLRGPNGWVGFSNLVSDSVLINLANSGPYTLTAQGAVNAYDIAYAFKLAETVQTDLPLSTPFTGQFVGSAQAQLFRISLTNGGPLRIVLANAGAGNRLELFAARGEVPTRGVFDYRSALGSGGNYEILIPNAYVGTVYVLVYADNIASPGPFTIQASTAGVFLAGSTPDRQARNAALTMTLTGAGFEAGTTVELLLGGDNPYSATNVSVDSYTQLTATFPPNLAPPGSYSVRVRQPDGDTAILTNVFTMLESGAPKLVTRLLMLTPLGRHATSTMLIEYANEGTVSMPAPLLLLRSSDPDGSDRPILTIDETRLVQNFNSAGRPPGTATEIFILASGEQAGVLNPGERFRVPVYYLGLLPPWNFSDGQVEMEIRYWTVDDSSTMDWTPRKETLRPPSLDAATWDVVYANLTAGLATTGDYVRMLNDNAQYLGRLGQHVKNVDELWNFELQQAYGYSALSVLDSALDSALPTPGVSLTLSRRFSSNLRARNGTGWFGRGWYTPWQARLSVHDGADYVTLVGEAGAIRRFSRDTRNSSYFSDTGDVSALVAMGGGIYELREPNGIVTCFRNDGRIDYVKDPNGNRTTAAYDVAGRLKTLSHNSGAFISVAYGGDGFVQSVTNSAGRGMTYDYSGENLQTVTTDDSKVTSYTYESSDAPAKRHALRSVTRGGATRQFTYNAQGRLASTYLAAGEQLVQFGYDNAGGVTVTDAQGTTRLFFDHRSLLAKTVDPLGNITTAEYDNERRLSRLIAPTGESQSFSWCDCGSLTGMTDELGHTTTFRYDNPFKRLTSFADARGNATRFNYDERGNLFSIIYPNGTIERFGSQTASGLPQSYTNRRSHPITYIYKDSGRVGRQTFADGSFAGFEYDARGNLTNVLEHPAIGPDKVTAYHYDYTTSGNRLRKVTYPNLRWVEFSYDALGRRERMTDSSGQDLHYDFDGAGRLWRLRDVTNAVLAEYLYNGAGQVQRLNKGNGTYTTYNYDAAGRLLHLINYAPNGGVNTRFDYTYDRRGRRRTMSTVDGDWTYDYDTTGQLLRGTFASRNAAIPSQDLQYIYDDAGNRVRTIDNGVTKSYVANNLNQYVSVAGTTQQYDADGNLTFDGVNTYEWDQLSRLLRITGPDGITEYEYGALGDRTATVLNGKRAEYLLDPTGLVEVVAEYGDAADPIVRNVFGLGLVGRSRDSGFAEYFEFDGIGATAATTDQSAEIMSRYGYDPFGRMLLSSAAAPNPFRFVGQFGIMSEKSDLFYMRARYFSARYGRFVSPDPTSIASSDPNLYRYALNNPVSRIDVNGLFSMEISGFVTAGAGVGFSLQFGADGIQWSESLGAGAGASFGVGFNTGSPGSKGGDTGSTISAAALIFGATKSSGTDGGSWGLSVGPGGGVFVGQYWTEPTLIFPWPWVPSGNGGNSGPGAPGTSGPGSPGAGPSPGSPGAISANGGSGVAFANDPNQKFGANGIGLENWLRPDAVIPYRIYFENLGPGSVDGSGNPYTTFASAPAQRVTVTDPLSPSLDWSTFQLLELAFGDTIIPVPAGRTHIAGAVPMTFNGQTFNVELEAGIDLANGRVFATFQSIEPSTSLPPEVLTGFLPPEDGTGRGKGHFSFLVHPRTNLTTGTEIRNVALIEFDRQTSIATDQVDPQNPAAGVDPTKQALNTIDAGPPTSTVALLPAESGRAFWVRWAGADDIGGSGIESYDVFVSTNGGSFVAWIEGTNGVTAPFIGELGKTYAFYSIARDKVGNQELPPVVPDAQTIVITNAPLISMVTDLVAGVGESIVISNRMQTLPASSFLWSLAGRAPFGASINTSNGVLRWTPVCTQGSTTNTITVWATDRARTNISDAIGVTVTVKECVAPQLGRLVLRTGDAGRLPINLITSVELTNLITLVSLPTNRFINLGVEALATQICFAAITATNAFPLPGGEGQGASELHQITLTTCTNQFLIGTQQVAWLVLTAVTNQRSAFVPVEIGPSIGTQPEGAITTNYVTQTGTVVVVGEEPLLESTRTTNSLVQLILYSKTGVTNRVQRTLSLPVPGPWTEWQQIIPSNILENLTPLRPTNRVMLFRAVQP